MAARDPRVVHADRRGDADRRSLWAQLIAGKPNQASLNIAPSVSPDGKYMMFLSERSLFSIDLYLADAAPER
jgi:Tol biopolymer transport system component